MQTKILDLMRNPETDGNVPDPRKRDLPWLRKRDSLRER